MENDILIQGMGVGALLYTPALNETLADSVINGKFAAPYSLAICLEDTISEAAVPKALKQLGITLQGLWNFKTSAEYGSEDAGKRQKAFFPKIFIRVRNYQQMPVVYEVIKDYAEIVCGFIFPKYSMETAGRYNEALVKINVQSEKKFFMMPILESQDIVELKSRQEALYAIKEKTENVKDFVLNIRVGGNDFSKAFRVRRHADESIYDILPIAQIFSDILTVFREHIVSGPVWEYFSGPQWESGLMKECRLDRLNGFLGKTVIHPAQIPIVNKSLAVSKEDYQDAAKILALANEELRVEKSALAQRMNEAPTHLGWAKKIMALADYYGVEDYID
ncbi:MAG: HpcH/HpaI aldolase/citrate lyase family protein [Lachnospiraceae bacterium]|nr:HpcH/HpaI aldolase/citrate lyase family protein [Lachnospiraceae bacterium]